MLVPSESFSDKLMFHFYYNLLSWFPGLSTSQSVRTSSSGRTRVDSTINYKNISYVVEFAAHTTGKDVHDHIKRTRDYKMQTGSDIAWMVYISIDSSIEVDFKQPITKYPEVSILHVQHNIEFNNFKCFYYSIYDSGTSSTNFKSIQPTPPIQRTPTKLTPTPKTKTTSNKPNSSPKISTTANNTTKSTPKQPIPPTITTTKSTPTSSTQSTPPTTTTTTKSTLPSRIKPKIARQSFK